MLVSSASSLLRTCCGSSAARRLSSFGFVDSQRRTMASFFPKPSDGDSSVTRLSKRTMFTTATTTTTNSTLTPSTTMPTAISTTTSLGTLLQLGRRVRLSPCRDFSSSVSSASNTQPIIEFVEEESSVITTPEGEQFSKDIDLKTVVDNTYIADVALLSSSFAFISSFLFWGALVFVISMISSVLDDLGGKEPTEEEVKEEKAETGKTKPQEEEQSTSTATTTPTTPTTVATTTDEPYPPEIGGIEAMAWIFLPLGIVAASIGRASLWHLRRRNLPYLRGMIFGDKTDMFIWAQQVAYATAPVYVTGGTIILTCYMNKAVKEIKSDGTVNWKWVRTFDTKDLSSAVFMGLFISFFGCFLMAPGIMMGGLLGGRLIQRRMLINARKLQQQMNSYLSQKKVKISQ